MSTEKMLFERRGNMIVLMSRLPIAEKYPLAEPPATVHVAKIGTYYHPATGEALPMTEEMFRAWAAQANREGADVLLDWDHRSAKIGKHPELKNPAAAWFERGSWRIEGDELVCNMRSWTPDGAHDVTGGYYRYVSPGIEDVAVDTHSGKLVTRLHHVALTNTPVLDNVTPLSMSRGGFNQEGDVAMKDKVLSLLKARGIELPADATEEAIAEALQKQFDVLPAALGPAIGLVEGEKPTLETVKTTLSRARLEVPLDLRRALGDEKGELPALVQRALEMRGKAAGGDELERVRKRLTTLERQQIDDELADAFGDGRANVELRADFAKLLASENEAVVATTRTLLSRLPRTGPAAPALPGGGARPAPNHNAYIEAFSREFGTDPKKVAEKIAVGKEN